MIERMTLFDAARNIHAADVARYEGMNLTRKGQREWTCCPFHNERTPSMCFFPDGRWYCFGCHAHGDSVDLYAALHGVSAVEAARALSGKTSLPHAMQSKTVEPPPNHDARIDEDGFGWNRLCDILNRAKAVEDEENADTPRLWAAVAAQAEAEIRLENLLAAEGGVRG